MGADTLIVKPTIRPGYGKARGPTEMNGFDAVVGIFAASPIKAWSY